MYFVTGFFCLLFTTNAGSNRYKYYHPWLPRSPVQVSVASSCIGLGRFLIKFTQLPAPHSRYAFKWKLFQDPKLESGGAAVKGALADWDRDQLPNKWVKRGLENVLASVHKTELNRRVVGDDGSAGNLICLTTLPLILLRLRLLRFSPSSDCVCHVKRGTQTYQDLSVGSVRLVAVTALK